MANPWDPDIDFNTAVARRLVASQFPEYADASLVPFGQGWDNRLLLLNDRWILRFPVRHLAGSLIINEMAALPYLQPRLSLPIPSPAFAGEPDEDYPFRWMGYDKLPGEVLCRIDPPPATAELASQVGAFLRELHASDSEVVEIPHDVHDKANLDARFEQVDERFQRLIDDDIVPAEDGRNAIGLARDLSKAEGWRQDLAIVHGDLYGYHILSDGVSATGIIDWGDIHRGDPAIDLSIGYSWFSGDARHALFDAYGAIDDATHARARFRAIFYAPILIQYGKDIGDMGVEMAGWRALELTG